MTSIYDKMLEISKTSSAGAERRDGPHKGGLRRAGPNDFMFVCNSIFSILFVLNLFFCY